ncbi:hypothetical protein IU510_27225 [Nocardia cyriacigeorgica]|uniref:hypothetical protein n=1 Tax=Nocardia cyriacigeorgica TaxID=135487 RepID=UPI001895A31F|nr:hypothetical protein [Nocardia cyriacigeorgica]MBF6101716.1 hypothetical protein [Nocardia cyriacigeorgica]
MGRHPKQPNHQLADLLDETRSSRKGLARRVVERGRAVGIELRYDHTSVGRWLAGERPTPPGPNLIAEVLTELCGRRITPFDCGMSASESADLGLEFSLSLTEATASVTELWRSDVERRRFLEGAAYAVAVYPIASMRWLTLPGREHPVSSAGFRRVGVADIDAVRTMTTAFRDLDNQVGGGKVRSTVVHYLHTSVAPLLRGSYTEELGRRLFAATAELTKLAGWAAYDLEEHGLAQRYLIQALRMARAAGDAALGAEILAAMSHQATYVGRPGDAVDLARAAQIAARSAGLPALEAGCHMVEAHGHAARSDARSCGDSLNAAEGAFDRDNVGRPTWLTYLDSAYMSAKAGQCFRDLGENDRAAVLARQSLDMSDGYQRGKVFNLCLLASSLIPEDPHEAIRIGTKALELSGTVESRRTGAYLRDVRARLAPYRDIPAVEEFRDRVANARSV